MSNKPTTTRGTQKCQFIVGRQEFKQRRQKKLKNAMPAEGGQKMQRSMSWVTHLQQGSTGLEDPILLLGRGTTGCYCPVPVARRCRHLQSPWLIVVQSPPPFPGSNEPVSIGIQGIWSLPLVSPPSKQWLNGPAYSCRFGQGYPFLATGVDGYGTCTVTSQLQPRARNASKPRNKYKITPADPKLMKKIDGFLSAAELPATKHQI